MSPAQKIAAVFQMSEMLLRLSQANVRRLHPTLDDREVFLRTAARHLDRETMIRAYGWAPESSQP
jgi:predicted RNA-binding Zn ribbon-like protein